LNPKITRAMTEAAGLARAPQRTVPLLKKLVSDKFRITLEHRHLYSYTRTKYSSQEALKSVMNWIADAQRPNGGIAAYYSLLTGYAPSYPEVTGYIIPTLYDFARCSEDRSFLPIADRATDWLLSLQMSDGSFPAGIHGPQAAPSIFNTGQILQGLVRSYIDTDRSETIKSAQAAGDWLIRMQQPDGSWSGPGTYQNSVHTYYSMVSWSLAELSTHTDETEYALAAETNLDWVLSHFRPNGWVDGINLQGHPTYLHFIAYVLQGSLECAILRRRSDAIDMVANSGWQLLRRFETNKLLAGAYNEDFKPAGNFTCLTGNAQMSCVWLRLFEITRDLRYLNAALKINEMLKQLIPLRGRSGIRGGVAGSCPIWGRYQPFRYLSWGCKFFADALLLESRLKQSFAISAQEVLQCAS
jgi:hypothetical protein